MDYIKLSKALSYALRHAPWEYELELDEYGWVDLEQVLESFKETNAWKSITENDLHAVIAASDKKRFEIENGKIRAFYGHSIPQKIIKEKQEPPETLFHGTARNFIPSIKANGLLPQKRQYVHLSADIETAILVGKRRDGAPIVLKVRAREAWRNGVNFYLGNEKIWLADSVPSQFIDFD